MYKYTKHKGLDSREIALSQRTKTSWTWHVSFQPSPKKKNCMPITRLIFTQWKFTTPDQLASPSKFWVMLDIASRYMHYCVRFYCAKIMVLLCKDEESLLCSQWRNSILAIHLVHGAQAKVSSVFFDHRVLTLPSHRVRELAPPEKLHIFFSSHRDTYPQFLRSPLGTPGTLASLMGRTNEKTRTLLSLACPEIG